MTKLGLVGPHGGLLSSTRFRRALCLTGSLVLHLATGFALSWMAVRAAPRLVKTATPVVVMIQADVGTNHPNAPEDLNIHVDERSSRVRLPEFTVDYQKVVRHAASLFPFLTGRVSLETNAAQASTMRRGTLTNPLVNHAEYVGRPLTITDAALQALLDASWSRRDRWRVFEPIAAAARQFDPDVGRLSDLLRGYEEQNGLQPYVDASLRDPRLWVELGLAADHADFIDFIGTFTAQHPRTRARIDLLFLLDKIAQASLDALVTLLDSIPMEDLQWTKTANPQAFDAVRAIQRYYMTQLQRRDLTTRRALVTYYDAARISILANIVETTPDKYRVNDALYLMGKILWTGGRTAEATGWWRALEEPHQQDEYANECTRIRAELNRAPSAPLDAAFVNTVLNADRGRWLSFSATRLRRFGYHFDTF